MSKGSSTHTAILNQALSLASAVGLEGLTIGALAKRVGMSKSGLYAHFKSKEELQIQVLDSASHYYSHEVFQPILKQARGLPRLQALFENWLDWVAKDTEGGCPFISAIVEFDDREGPVREHIAASQRRLVQSVARTVDIAKQVGDLDTKTDSKQFAFELWGIIVAFQFYTRLLEDSTARDRAHRAFQKLITDART